jgi:hypothetical protein
MTTLTTTDDVTLIDGIPVFPVFGGATPTQGGIVSSGDSLATHTADGVDLNDIWDLVIAAMDEWNNHRTQISDLLAFRTTVPGEAVPQGVSTPSFERLTEYGVPQSANVPADALILGYEFHDWGQATRFTWRALRQMTSDNVFSVINGVLHSDNRLVTSSILKRLFTPTPKTNESGHTCFGLYNLDGTIPPPYLGREFTDISHYLTSGNATIDSQDIEDAMRIVRSHGYGLGNGSQLLILANPDESEKIQGWRKGVESRPSSGILARHDFIPSGASWPYLSEGEIVGTPVSGDFHGIEVLGSYGPAILVETNFVPSGYVAICASNGPNSPDNVVGVREHPLPNYRGLLAVGGSPNYPIQDSTYIRSFGTGVRQRGGAVVVQCTAGSYTAPTIAL